MIARARSWFACLLAAALALGAAHGRAEPPPEAREPREPRESDAAERLSEDEAEEVARDSPRASLAAFLKLCRAGDYESAAAYLELSPEEQARGASLARRLKAVLDRRAWVELEALSPRTGGDSDDGLSPFTDELGRIEGPEHVLEPIRIVRRRRGARWMFSSATVGRIDAWYQRLEDRWLLEHLPEPLLASGPRELMWWQWIALPLLIGLSLVCALVLSYVSSKLVVKLALRRVKSWDDAMAERIRRPLALFWTLGVLYSLLPSLGLYAPAEKFVHHMLHTAFLVGFFWSLSRVIDVGAHLVSRSPWAGSHDASRSLVSLGARVIKVGLMAIAVVALLSQLGYPVASILAGLGVGGLAVALAAQKTVENLFGAFSIGADQPFREGDFVRVDDFVATVELIGLRSTRFRTLDRTLITIPNGKLAEMKLETFAARDRLRFASVIGLARSSTPEQVREVMAAFEQLLKRQPKLWPDSAGVRFEKFGPSSLDIEVSAYFATRDWGEFQLIRQELLLAFMAAIERAGTSLALPTSAIQLAQRSAAEGAPTPPE